jgi:glycosyltransferase involved in cell wall biosynthesis
MAQLLLAIRQFVQLLRLRPDVVHTHEHPAHLAAAVAYLAWSRRRVRLVHTVHVDPVERRAFWKRATLGFLLAQCTMVTTVSEHTARRLGNIAAPVPRSVRVIHGGVSLELPEPGDRSIAEFRTRFGLTGNPILCQIGAMNFPLKVAGVLQLVEAFAVVLTHVPTAMLLLVGDGRLRNEVEAACARAGVNERTVLTGFVEDVSLPLAVTDVYCHFTLQEALGLSVLEAMRAGKPVVASRAGGIPEVIADGADGILVEDSNPQLIARAIVTLLEHPQKMRKLGARASAKVRERFTWQHAAAEFAVLYELPGRQPTRG